MNKSEIKGLLLAIAECERRGCAECAAALRAMKGEEGEMSVHTKLRWQERYRRDPALVPDGIKKLLGLNAERVT